MNETRGTALRGGIAVHCMALHRRVALALAVLGATTAAGWAKGYMTPGFQTKTSRPMTLALLPPHAEVIKEKAVMTDDMPEESAALEREAAQALKAQLEERGYAVKVLTPADIARNPGVKDLVRKVNERYDEEWSKILRRPKQVREKRYRPGDDVVRLASALKVQGVVVTRIQAVGVSKGKATMRYFSNSAAPHSYARVDFGVLEGKAGFVEGYFFGYENTSLGQILKKPALVMGQAVEHAAKTYPAADEAREAAEPAAVPARAADDAADESAIEDFEVLLKDSAGAGSQKH